MEIEGYRPDHLAELQMLVNHHISAVIPGCALPAPIIEQHLRRNLHQIVIDPWVAERRTLVVTQRHQVIAAAHLLRYAEDDGVGVHYRGVGDVAWLLATPENAEAAGLLLDHCVEHLRAWGVSDIRAWDSNLPAPMIFGIPEVWTHLTEVFTQAGFRMDDGRREAIYGGWLHDIPTPGDPPLPGLTIKRTIGDVWSTRFAVWHEGESIGECECVSDLMEAGSIPSLRGWSELGTLYIWEAWRNRGIGAWLVQHAVAWLRLAGCDRIVLSVAQDDDAAGAGRFYRRFGWDVITHMQDGWHLPTL